MRLSGAGSQPAPIMRLPSKTLVATPPGRPPQSVADLLSGRGEQGGEQASDLDGGQRDPVVAAGGVMRVRTGRRGSSNGQHGQEGQREHGQGDEPVPRSPAADLVLSRPTWPLAAWKDSSTHQRIPATLTRTARVTGAGVQQR